MSRKEWKIPFNKPFIAGKELYYISQAVLHGHLSGDGPFTQKCHQWLESRLNCKRALLTHSCTAALEMAAILCDVKPGDEVIMPSFTFVSTANAFVLRGAVPVFVDIREDTLNIDETLIESAITGRTRILVPVHYAGLACAMDRIMDIGKAKHLFVVEDAAQALFSSHGETYLGTIGDMGCLSFHETKNNISGEGGALLINNPRLVERAEIIREKGTNRAKFFRGEVDKYTWVDIGSSYLPSELIGAFLYAQLEEAEEIISARRRLYLQYRESLQPLEKEGFFRLPPSLSAEEFNAHIFFLLTRSLDERTNLIEHLKSMGILSVFHYLPLHSSPAGLKYGRPHGDLSVTTAVSERLLRLPLYFEMTESEVMKVVNGIKGFYLS
jgi:dTDP-4-amino-4,6-dideoxygalactose transaminase